MTLVVAAFDPADHSVCIAADSKVTWLNDATRTRHIYTEPALKVILLDGDLAVGYAGSGPDELAEMIVRLRGSAVDEVLSTLSTVAAAAFVVVQREPARIWMVSAETGVEDRTAIGRGWAGDQDAYTEFQKRFDNFAAEGFSFQLRSSLQSVVHLVRPETVGGYVVMATGSASEPFRYCPLESHLFPEANAPAQVTNLSQNPDGTVNITLHLTFNEGPLTLRTLPGEHPTLGALGLYLEDVGIGYVYPHSEPATRIEVRASTLRDFVSVALADHGQHLSAPTQPATTEEVDN